MPAWVSSKAGWASWVLESILFLALALTQKEEALQVDTGPVWDTLTISADWVSWCHGLG